MANITTLNLDGETMRNLRIRAAENGHSTEEEARQILRHALSSDPLPRKNLGTAIHQLFKVAGGVELDTPPRQRMRKPPRFD